MKEIPFDWKRVHELTSEKSPNPSLKRALSFVEERENALDLGCGPLVDSRYLLASGFAHVVAVDAEPSTKERAEKEKDERLEVIISRFEEYDFPKDAFDIVNAQRSLFFLSPDAFPVVFQRMVSSLKPGGIFVGQLLGPHDEWHGRSDMTFHTREEVENLFSDMEDVEITTVESDGLLAQGTSKHWHLHQIRARKKKSA